MCSMHGIAAAGIPNYRLPDLLCCEEHHTTGNRNGPAPCRDRGRAEERLGGRPVDDRQDNRDRRRFTEIQERVAEKPDPEQRSSIGAVLVTVRDLGDHDAGVRHGDGLPIKARRRR